MTMDLTQSKKNKLAHKLGLEALSRGDEKTWDHYKVLVMKYHLITG
jgi:hypothetical protein